ncbi:uncharacterized protein J4E92_010984 [Alternaria infectoria]|uniref:uncharacterized protein n=1 Tax=Alternaria infectoria TaxID=45303 RepID=UPI00221EB959|nr:uncharacterized protein J4E92_010984 [Alternaria infectoria]KAI4908038.1 hypothetical protein J4E92_010984 [Alternaria infectoria]
MAYATFADLPPEMVGNVFAFIRSKPDQGSVCLISRALRDLMAPMMWEELETDFRDVSTRQLATLLHPESRITSNVRKLDVGDSASSADGEDFVKMLLTAIPNDRLWTFASSANITTLTFHMLLQSQRKLKLLDTFTYFTTPGLSKSTTLDSAEHHTWIGLSLTNISSMTLEIIPHQVSEKRIFRSIESISKMCPRLEELLLTSHSLVQYKKTSLCAILGHAKEFPLFASLTILRLYGLRLIGPGHQAICKSLDLSKLCTLDVQGCDHHVLFMQGLSSYYASGTGDLQDLCIALPLHLQGAQKTVESIEGLLKVCPKLRILRLVLESHGLVDKDYIITHGQSLHSLMIGTGSQHSVRIPH